MARQGPGPREALFAAIVAQCSKITQQNEYATNAGENVFRLDLLAEQVSTRLPCILVLEPLTGESYKPYDAKVYEVTMPVLIAGMVHVGTSDVITANTHTALNELINDVMAALLEDPTFGGACKDSVLERTSTYVDVARADGYFAILMHTTYHIERGVL